MQPVIVLVGRPNVGKSTLFNRLTRTRDALVTDLPGLTRDRQYGAGKVGRAPYWVVDTGGLTGDTEGLGARMSQQALVAVEQASTVLFLVDGREGLTAADEIIAEMLRRYGKLLFLVVNKCDGIDAQGACAEFQSLGLGEAHAIAASHGRGVGTLMDAVLASSLAAPTVELTQADAGGGIRIAIVGRPNVGKSTLVNRLLGEERVLTDAAPGTTRDSVSIPFTRAGRHYTLIDTAGIRRRARVHEQVEKFSVIKTLQAITAAHVVILVMDAQQGIGNQDASLLGYVLESGRALTIAVNKWDGLAQEQRAEVRRILNRQLAFIDFASIHFISALHGSGLGELFVSVDRAFTSATARLATPALTRILEQALATHPPPLVRGRRIKLRYAHQGGHNPPLIVIHGNQTAAVPDSYRRYLANTFRSALGITGTPIHIEFKSSKNPYAGRKNTLTPRQKARRRRLLSHVKKRS
jgi:ribosome-associated GTPase EngA